MKHEVLARILALILAVILLLSLVMPVLADETDHVVIKLHYHRPDETYTDWSI